MNITDLQFVVSVEKTLRALPETLPTWWADETLGEEWTSQLEWLLDHIPEVAATTTPDLVQRLKTSAVEFQVLAPLILEHTGIVVPASLIQATLPGSETP